MRACQAMRAAIRSRRWRLRASRLPMAIASCKACCLRRKAARLTEVSCTKKQDLQLMQCPFISLGRAARERSDVRCGHSTSPA